MPTTPRLQRRSFFSLAGASLLSRPAPVRQEALATPIRDSLPALNVAGPRESDVADWARLLARPLAAGLMEGGRLDLRYGGGIDGVTGANQFDARTTPDGREALLFPGSVALGGLAGSRAVHFDCARALPLLAALGTGVLMVRGPLPAPGAGPGLRLASGARDDGALVALLGLDLLGIPALAVSRAQDANAVFLAGPHAGARAPALMRAGYRPALRTSADHPAFATAPFFLALLPAARSPGDELVQAWRALAAAADLSAALVLPRLSPASAVLRWRQAARSGLEDDGVAGQARRQSLRLVAGDGSAEALGRMHLAAGPQIALRRWFSQRADL